MYRDSLPRAEAVLEHRELPFKIAQRRPVRVVLCADWLRACRVVPPMPSGQGWHGACNPASLDLLERDAGFVRLIELSLPVTAVARQRRLSPDL